VQDLLELPVDVEVVGPLHERVDDPVELRAIDARRR
jgi:hypothetical protein